MFSPIPVSNTILRLTIVFTYLGIDIENDDAILILGGGDIRVLVLHHMTSV